MSNIFSPAQLGEAQTVAIGMIGKTGGGAPFRARFADGQEIAQARPASQAPRQDPLEQARADAVAKRQALENAETELRAASAAESAAREAVRTAQREANAAREQHANAEREINRHASRRSALDERRTRLTEDRNEAHGAHEAAIAALSDLPSSAEN